MNQSPYFTELTRRQHVSRLAPVLQPEYFIGLDLGQARDHTAIAVLERVEEVVDRNMATYEWNTITRRSFRYLERLPLGIDYPSIVQRVRDIVTRPEILGRSITLVVDHTGVGRPVVDLLRNADLPCQIVPVTITGGDTENCEGGNWRVPKRNLISGLVVLFQCGSLISADTWLIPKRSSGSLATCGLRYRSKVTIYMVCGAPASMTIWC